MGKEIYAQECRQYHLSLKAVAGNKHLKLWKQLLSKEEYALAQLPLNDQEAKPSWSYFKEQRPERCSCQILGRQKQTYFLSLR